MQLNCIKCQYERNTFDMNLGTQLLEAVVL
jgi:hypothetical protein